MVFPDMSTGPKMDKMFVSPDFVDVYLPLVTSLLEDSPRGKIDIYKYCVQYFQEKLTEREEIEVPTEKPTPISEGKAHKDVSPKHGNELIKPDFTYDSILKQNLVNSYQKQIELGEFAKSPKDTVPTPEKEQITPKERVGSLEDNVNPSNELLKQMIEFSDLLPGYIEVMAEFLDKLGDERKPSLTLKEKVKKFKDHISVKKKNQEKADENHVLFDETSSKAKKEDKGAFQKRLRSIHSQTKLTGDLHCKKCGASAEVISPSVREPVPFPYVRNIVRTATGMLKSIHTGVQKHFVLEEQPQQMWQKPCKIHRTVQSPSHTRNLFASLENCLGSVKCAKEYVTSPEFWISDDTETTRKDASVQTLEDEFQNPPSKGKYKFLGSKEKPTVSSSEESDEYFTKSGRKRRLSPKKLSVAQAIDIEFPKKSTSSEEFFIPRKDIKATYPQLDAIFKEDNEESSNIKERDPKRQDKIREISKTEVVDHSDQKFSDEGTSISEKVNESNNSSTTLSLLTLENKDTPMILEFPAVDRDRNKADEFSETLPKEDGSPETAVAGTQQITSVDGEDLNKVISHSVYQTTFLMQSRINKIKSQYKLKPTKSGIALFENDKPIVILDSGPVLITGRSWLRTFFMTRMIRRYQKAFETENQIDESMDDLGIPMLKHRDVGCGYRTFFNRPGIFSAVRTWYFMRQFREYQKKATIS